MVIQVAVIGLGHQAVTDHIPAIMESKNHELTAVVDSNPEKIVQYSKEYNTSGFTFVTELLKNKKVDIAIVAVPHHAYLGIIKELAESKVHIIKEKPFATSPDEAMEIWNLIQTNKVFLGVTLQRRFNPIYQTFHQLKNRIGKIYSIEGRYTLNVSRLDDGWRSSKSASGGGALIDMGYHYIDLLVWYMGLPVSVMAMMTRGNRNGQIYDVEDTVHLMFDYKLNCNHEERTVGHFVISRNYSKKEESITVCGTDGIIELQRGQVRRLTPAGEEIESLQRSGGWPSAALDQLDFFTRAIQGHPDAQYDLTQHFQHVAIIQAAYESDRTGTTQNPQNFLKSLTKEVKNAE